MSVPSLNSNPNAAAAATNQRRDQTAEKTGLAPRQSPTQIPSLTLLKPAGLQDLFASRGGAVDSRRQRGGGEGGSRSRGRIRKRGGRPCAASSPSSASPTSRSPSAPASSSSPAGKKAPFDLRKELCGSWRLSTSQRVRRSADGLAVSF
jgi:hypothetical protein